MQHIYNIVTKRGGKSMENSNIFEMEKNQNSAFYVDNNHQKYINMAKRKHRNDLLASMEDSYERTISSDASNTRQPNFATAPPEQQQQNQAQNNNGNFLSTLLNNIDLKTILPLLSGNKDLSSLTSALEKDENSPQNPTAGIFKLLNNPALKDIFKGKKRGKFSGNNTTNNIDSSTEETSESIIATYEKLETE